MKTPIEIRAARPGDGPDAVDLLKDLGYPVTPEVSRRFVDTFAHLVAHPEVSVFVASAHLDVVGFVTVSIRPQLRLGGPMASIDELVVASEHRDQGVGERLLDKAIERGREMRCLRVEVQTSRTRESYQRDFYVKHGFSEAESAILRMLF